MKKQRIFVLVIILVISSRSVGTLTEIDLEVDPVISHFYDEAERNIVDRLYIDLPSTVLSPSDIFRVNVSFTDEQAVKVTDASLLAMEPVFSTAGVYNSSGFTNNGTIKLEITDYQDILNTSRSATPFCAKLLSTEDYLFAKGFPFEQSLGEIIDGSLFSAFTVEFTVPTTVNGAPFSTKTYNSNCIRIEAYLDDTFDHNILTVVPEPGTILLLGLGGVVLLRRRSG